MKWKVLIPLLSAFLIPAAVLAQDEETEPAPAESIPVPQSLKLEDEELDIVDELIVPIPLEIFNSLSQIGVTNWDGRTEFRSVTLNTNRARTALIFGHIVSTGFIAVQERDKGDVRRTGLAVMKVAKALGVGASVEKHATSIETAAYSNRWKDVRSELDRVRQTVLDKMEELRDDDLSTLVSLGGWLGGTETLSEILSETYSKDGSDLLNQPGLVRQLRIRFENLPETSKNGSFFLEIEKTLSGLEELMQTDDAGMISLENVKEIYTQTTGLVDAIYAE